MAHIGNHTQPAYTHHARTIHRATRFRELQDELLRNPAGGDVIEGTGGLRKMRFGDSRRGKGKRGGLRIIYYFWINESEFWLFGLYDKDEAADLSPQQRAVLKDDLKRELRKRLQ
jgi:hypothetical protein